MCDLTRRADHFIEKLTRLGCLLRDAVIRGRKAGASLAEVSRETSADTIYSLDTHVEPELEDFYEQWGRELPLVLIAEGAGVPGGMEGVRVFPDGTDPGKAAFRLIVDPIDGTRGLMYNKRSAWVLAGVAPNRGEATRLSDIFAAAQVEVPTSRQDASDILFATRGGGATRLRQQLRDGSRETIVLRPSRATNIAHGFATVVSFFPGTKVLAAELLERVTTRTLGPLDVTRPMVFDDQYISSGGQLYEMMCGHDRFIGDLRPMFYQANNSPMGLCAHPYDLCTALIASEAGLIITNGQGGPLDGPLDVQTPLAWAAYANEALHRQIEPIIIEFLAEKGALLRS